MTPEEKRSLAEAKEMINRFAEMHPLEDGDFDDEGKVTKAATLRFLSDVQRVLPEKALRAFQKYVFEKRMNAYLSELAAIGALERVPSKTGMPAYRKVRDWSKEEAERARARAEARIQMSVQ